MKVYGSGGGMVDITGLHDRAIPVMWKLVCIHIHPDIAPMFRGFAIAVDIDDTYFVYALEGTNGVDWEVAQYAVYEEYAEGMLNCLLHVQRSVEEIQEQIDTDGNESIWLADYNTDGWKDVRYVDSREVEELEVPLADYVRFYIEITESIVSHGMTDDESVSFDWTKTMP